MCAGRRGSGTSCSARWRTRGHLSLRAQCRSSPKSLGDIKFILRDRQATQQKRVVSLPEVQQTGGPSLGRAPPGSCSDTQTSPLLERSRLASRRSPSPACRPSMTPTELSCRISGRACRVKIYGSGQHCWATQVYAAHVRASYTALGMCGIGDAWQHPMFDASSYKGMAEGVSLSRTPGENSNWLLPGTLAAQKMISFLMEQQHPRRNSTLGFAKGTMWHCSDESAHALELQRTAHTERVNQSHGNSGSRVRTGVRTTLQMQERYLAL